MCACVWCFLHCSGLLLPSLLSLSSSLPSLSCGCVFHPLPFCVCACVGCVRVHLSLCACVCTRVCVHNGCCGRAAVGAGHAAAAAGGRRRGHQPRGKERPRRRSPRCSQARYVCVRACVCVCVWCVQWSVEREKRLTLVPPFTLSLPRRRCFGSCRGLSTAGRAVAPDIALQGEKRRNLPSLWHTHTHTL